MNIKDLDIKAKFFVEIKFINKKHGQGTHSTQMGQMGADKLAENTPKAPKCICPNCLPKPKSFGFR